ncbi:MAG: diguanylate cyclase [Pseudomonadota bacterium]
MKDGRIVLLERDDLAREVYAEYLVAEGFQVRVEALLDHALAALRKGNAPLLIAGIAPGIASVPEIALKVRRVSPRTALLAILGRDSPDAAMRQTSDYALETLVRPVTADALLVSVWRCLETVALLSARPAMRHHVELFQAIRRIQHSSTVTSAVDLLLDAALLRIGAEAGLVLRHSAGSPTEIVAARGLEQLVARALADAWNPCHLGETNVSSFEVLPSRTGPFAGIRAKIARLWPKAIALRIGKPDNQELLWAVLLSGAHSNGNDSLADRAASEDMGLLISQTRSTIEAIVRSADGEQSVDPLTSLYDGKYLRHTLVDEIKRAQRRGGSVALIVVDINGFRHINDTHGHLVGGRMLIEASRVILRTVRDVDVVARTGPDEFAIVLAASDSRSAARVSTRIREAFARHSFLAREGLALHVSVTAEMAVYPQHGSTADALLASANDALARMKHAPALG